MDLKELHTILDSVVERRLGKAIQQLENHLYAYPHPQAADQLERVKSDYMLMTGYWQQGYDDPERGQVYDRLLRRMYVLTTNVCIRHYIKNSSFVMGVYNRTRNGSRREWQPASLRRDMEAFVAGAALLELEPEHTREAKRQELYGQHLQMMSELRVVFSNFVVGPRLHYAFQKKDILSYSRYSQPFWGSLDPSYSWKLLYIPKSFFSHRL
jgi:hypothetical protein